MEPNRLLELYRLLTEYVNDPKWNRDGPAWAIVEEARREVETDLFDAGVVLRDE